MRQLCRAEKEHKQVRVSRILTCIKTWKWNSKLFKLNIELNRTHLLIVSFVSVDNSAVCFVDFQITTGNYYLIQFIKTGQFQKENSRPAFSKSKQGDFSAS